MATGAQKRARDKWNKKHASQSKVYSLRSTAKRFIKEYATNKDITDLRALLDERAKQLENEAR